jgi:Pvc16 N-terminal domain
LLQRRRAEVQAVIHEVDEALRRLVRDEALRGTDVEVAFDAPTKDWAARRNAPTVNVYLYDVREDVRRRQRGLLNEYDEDNLITARHLPPRHMKLSYLVTAWTQRPEDEHRLLSSLLLGFLRYEALPVELLSGTLIEFGLPVAMTVALPPPEDRAFADVWTALGGELKPSLDVVVSAPIESGRVYPANPPVEDGVQLNLGGDELVGHHVVPDEGRVAMRRVRRSAP